MTPRLTLALERRPARHRAGRRGSSKDGSSSRVRAASDSCTNNRKGVLTSYCLWPSASGAGHARLTGAGPYGRTTSGPGPVGGLRGCGGCGGGPGHRRACAGFTPRGCAKSFSSLGFAFLCP